MKYICNYPHMYNNLRGIIIRKTVRYKRRNDNISCYPMGKYEVKCY